MATLEEWFKKHDIQEVEVLIPDISGMARGKFLATRRYLADKGIRIAKSLFTQAVTGEYTDLADEINPTDADMLAVPDVKTMQLVPWARYPTAQIIHDCYNFDGTPVKLAPRQVLKQVVGFYEQRGWQAMVGPEVEFYLIKPNTDPNTPLEPPVGRSGRKSYTQSAFGIEDFNEYEEVIEQIYEFAEEQGVDPDTYTHEDGMAQIEINLEHGDAVELADQIFLFKRTAREAAFRHDMYATFMAKPQQNQPGSSMHLHHSVVDKETGKNLFADDDGKPNKLFMHYIAGLQKYMPAAMPMFAPNVNSYRRILRYQSSPINTHWGFDNRTAGLRVPHAPAQDTRVENRVPSADANVYLAIAASLAAGYLGIEEELEPTKPLEGDAYQRALTLPRDLYSALNLMRRSKPLARLLGEEFIRIYGSVKELEYEAYFQVISSWEREHLLLNV